MKNKSKQIVLTKFEQSLEDSLARGEWEVRDDMRTWKKEIQQAAQDTLELRKSKRITVRVNKADLIKLKAKAIEKNIPYQTLLNVLIHDFVEDK